MRILNNLFTRGWMTTKRHHPSDFQWYLLEREPFAWRGSCMPDLWIQTCEYILPCAFSSLFLPHKATKSGFESPLWRSLLILLIMQDTQTNGFPNLGSIHLMLSGFSSSGSNILCSHLCLSTDHWGTLTWHLHVWGLGGWAQLKQSLYLRWQEGV